MKISKHITLAEATKSQTAIRKGIDNMPGPNIIPNMIEVANKCFEPLREWHGKPIGISSFYRSAALNRAVKGSPRSQHMLGQAIDIDADIFDNGITNADIYRWLVNNVDFDQIIWEFGDDSNPAWVHVSYVGKGKNRRQELRIG
jgi:zinc D-Ala-D-Ala carboxypeptidase